MIGRSGDYAVGLYIASFVDLAHRSYFKIVSQNAEIAFQQKLSTAIPNAHYIK